MAAGPGQNRKGWAAAGCEMMNLGRRWASKLEICREGEKSTSRWRWGVVNGVDVLSESQQSMSLSERYRSTTHCGGHWFEG